MLNIQGSRRYINHKINVLISTKISNHQTETSNKGYTKWLKLGSFFFFFWSVNRNFIKNQYTGSVQKQEGTN